MQRTLLSPTSLVSFVVALLMASTLVLALAPVPSVYAQDSDDLGNLAEEAEDELIEPDALEIEPEEFYEPEAVPPTLATTKEEKAATEGAPASFATRDKCVAGLSSKSLPAIKKYGELSAKKRMAKLKEYNVKLNNQKKATKKSYKKDVKKYTINKGVKIQRIAHTNDIKREIAKTGSQIKAKRAAINAANDQQAAAAETCSMIYDIRVFTYLDAKIKNQRTIDNHYRQNALLRAQYESISATARSAQLSPEQNTKIAAMSNPVATKALMDQLQKTLDGIRPETINSIQASNPKKKTAAIFTESLKPQFVAAKKAGANDVKTAGQARAAAKASAASTKKTTATKKTTSSSKKKAAKKTLTTKQINEICKNAAEPRLQDSTSAKGKAELTKACNNGIKAGFNKKGANSRAYCSTGGKAWTAGKSPKKTEACAYGYDKGIALR